MNGNAECIFSKLGISVNWIGQNSIGTLRDKVFIRLDMEYGNQFDGATTAHPPQFLNICSITLATKFGIIFELLMDGASIFSRLLFTDRLVNSNIFQLIVAGISLIVTLFGAASIFKRWKSSMVTFLLMEAMSIILGIIAWIIIVINVSRMSLYEALCNSPGDCPLIFNPNYVVGLVISIVGAIFAFFELLKYWEVQERHQEQEYEARKRSAMQITTDIQTSQVSTPRSVLPSRILSSSKPSRPSSLCNSIA